MLTDDTMYAMSQKKYYLHSAIPYVNAAPHIGHAQEFVYSDVIRRYQKLTGKDVLYLCGADENALKIVQAAEKAHLPTQQFCDQNSDAFLHVAKKLDIVFDVWQRGSDQSHHFPASQKLWELCEKNGDIYKKSYSGLYCVGCEAFYTRDELNEIGECLEHPGKKLDEVTEENYFFRLSKYQEFIKDLITTDRLHVIPDVRKNEALAFIKKGLSDFSISRSRKRAKNWGVPVPNDPDQIMYVWFDALNIYQSGIGFGWNEEKYTTWWPPEVMVIGKGILRFHAIYWPAILKSAGLNIPKQLFVHGYLTVNGQKMSKTLGNVVDPIEMIEKYGTDAVRYYLLREIPSTADGDFSLRRFKELYTADLANGLGNLVSRIAKLCEKMQFEITGSKEGIKQANDAIEKYDFNEALSQVWQKIKNLDVLINKEQPWKYSQEKESEKLTSFLLTACIEIQSIAYTLSPFMPKTSEKIVDQFTNGPIKSRPPLFPRLT